jgi:hypothetical protein
MDIFFIIYTFIFKFWRSKRMRLFEEIMKPSADDVMLDVGGYPWFWRMRPQCTKRIDCVNLHAVNWDPDACPEHRITMQMGDGCALAYPDKTYDIVFSNSVVEHVGDWERQQAFAHEVRRVGRRLWIQTPAYECPVEPHYLMLGVHWFPVSMRRKILRWFTPWGWMTKPNQETVDKTIKFTQLLRRKQMVELFPDCQIVTERLFGLFPKSYIAIRTLSAPRVVPE